MKKYQGVRTPEGGAVVSVRTTSVVRLLPLRLDVWSHSPTGFEWGYNGSGPAQLALALLLDLTGANMLSLHYYQRFKREVVALLPYEGWILDGSEALAWLMPLLAHDLGLDDEIDLPRGEENGHAQH